METLKLAESCFNHKSDEQQKLSLLALVEAGKVFGNNVLEAGLERQKYSCGVEYVDAYVGFCRNKGRSWMLFIRERKLDQPYCNVYKDNTMTILLGWGFKIAVLTGDAPISEWGWNNLYCIREVPETAFEFFEKSEVSNYAELDRIIKKYKESLIWDETADE